MSSISTLYPRQVTSGNFKRNVSRLKVLRGTNDTLLFLVEVGQVFPQPLYHARLLECVALFGSIPTVLHTSITYTYTGHINDKYIPRITYTYSSARAPGPNTVGVIPA